MEETPSAHQPTAPVPDAVSDADAQARWDTIVVGGGAAGLSAAQMLGRARRRVLVIDAGEPRNRFAAHMHGVLGHDGADPLDLLAAGRAEAAAYGVRVVRGSVARVTPDAQRPATLEVTTTPDEATGSPLVLAARALVVATGLSDVLPDVPGLAERWGTSVLHCPYCHGWEVRGRRLGVLATSPLALHQVQLVRQWSEHVTLLAAGLGPLDDAVARRLRARGIDLVTADPVEVVGDGPSLTGVRTDDGAVVRLDALFVAGAPRPHDAFLAPLRLERTDTAAGSFLAVDPTGRTSHERVWAVGNVVAPAATVPMAMGAGATTGGAVNMALVTEDFDRAVAERVEVPRA